MASEQEEHVGDLRADSSISVPSKNVSSSTTTARPSKRKMGVPPIRRLSEDARPLSHVELDLHRKIIQSHTATKQTTVKLSTASRLAATAVDDKAPAPTQLISARVLARMRLGHGHTHRHSRSASYTVVADIPSTPAIRPATTLSYPGSTQNAQRSFSPATLEIPQTPSPAQLPYSPNFQTRRLISRSHSQPDAVVHPSHTAVRPTISNPVLPDPYAAIISRSRPGQQSQSSQPPDVT